MMKLRCLTGILIALLMSCSDSQQLSPDPTDLDLDESAPSCPGLSSVSVASGPSLSLTWGQATDNVSEASSISYQVFMKRSTDNYDLVSPIKILQGATSTLISNGVTIGNTYSLFVTCSDEKGNTFPTGPLNELSISVADSQPPSQITDLSAGNPSYTSILLTWSPSDDGSGGTTASNMRYAIYGSTASNVATSGSPISTTTGTTSFLHTGLSPNVQWHYKVVAVDALDNRSPASNESSATTLEDETPPTFAGGTPTITVGATTASTITLSWTAASDLVTSANNLTYRLYRCSGNTACNPYSGTLVTSTSGGVLSVVDNGLIAATTYVYGVRAEDSSGNITTNTNSKVAYTTFPASGMFYSFPFEDEVNTRAGSAVAVANVIGDAMGASAFPDLIVGVPNASEPGNTWRNTGCVMIYEGIATGVFSSTVTEQFCSPNATASGTLNGANFGTALAVGDMDKDGYDDIVVSAPLRANVYIYRTQNNSGVLSTGSSPTTIPHGGGNTTFGSGLCLGDSDSIAGSGLDIFSIVTSENCSVACGGVTGSGNIMVFENPSTAGNFIAPSSVSYRISPTQNLRTATPTNFTISNNEVVARSCTFGKFDPNNSTQDQLVVGSGTVGIAGANNDGVVYFYRKTGASSFTFENVLPEAAPSSSATNWGNAVSSIQLDATSTPSPPTTLELVVGAPADASVGAAAGAAYVYRVSTSAGKFILTQTGDSFFGGSDFDSNAAGSAVAAGNIWGHTTGRQDLVVAANLDDNVATIGANALNLGQLFTYRNSNGVLSSSAQQNQFDYRQLNVKVDHRYGRSLCRGDVNNDGREDVIIGIPGIDYVPEALANNQNAGQVAIHYGVAVGEIDFINPSQKIYAPGAQADSYFGWSCVVMDYNGDGENDLLVGSPYRDISGVTDRGIVYVYQGSENSPLPTASSSSIISPFTQATGLFGFSLAKGDLDGNGHDDLIVGAAGMNVSPPAATPPTAIGRVFVYWADATAPNAINPTNYKILRPPEGTPPVATNPHLANNQVVANNLNFGRSVGVFSATPLSTALDLIVCSSRLDAVANDLSAGSAAAADIGGCWIYEGRSNAGLTGDYQMADYPANDIRYPPGYSAPAANIFFGEATTSEDWNDDGHQDLIVCASRQTNLLTTTANAGACFAYFGKADGGFQTLNGYRPNKANTRYTPLPDSVHYNPNGEPTTASEFGSAVLLMDINNNSSLDLLIGDPHSDNPTSTTNLGNDSGRVYIIRGGY